MQVFWEKDGVENRRKWAGDLMAGQESCADLRKIDVLEEGSEVWLKFKIAGGDKESCRKSQKMIYANNQNDQYYYSKGTTLNGNRCRKVKKPLTESYVGPGTGNCEYSWDW